MTGVLQFSHRERVSPYYLFRDWKDSLGHKVLQIGLYHLEITDWLDGESNTVTLDFEITKATQDEFADWALAGAGMTDTTAFVMHSGAFHVYSFRTHLALSSRSENGVDIWWTNYFSPDDRNQISWTYKIIDGSKYYRNKYMNQRKKWIEDNPDKVFEVVHRSAFRLEYRLYYKGALVTLRLKNGRVSEVWNFNI